ncbi:integrase catalytic domain-containing protein [Trichonephila clavipes]|nr:integrase catalytic domain-containing protein [Trichonephila clavipes]
MCVSDLWKLDSLGISDPVETKTKLEIQKETLNHFQKTICVDISGRYEEYQDVLDLWLSGKIIEEVNDDKENFVHYLPHRPVIKENSTSKIRPVFDASARTKGSPSLNDCLEKGPNFIEVIPTILNRFRKYKIGVISDIEKAFLQIGVREQDRDFLRFMWYDRENRDHIKIYRHRRVVFGVTSSPFLLGATLNHHLDNAHGNFDNVAKILRKSFYVDNSHFNLRGWQSNVLLNPEKFSELESQPDNFETKVLGLIWNLKDDCLSCNINCQKNEGKAITKRSLLSIANHIFDPIGFTAPVTLKPKLILQEIWKLKLKWDENLPKDILNQVKKWLEQLSILASIKIPRCLNLSSNGIKRLTLHVFCDASKKAYAACVFFRVEYEENVFVKLIQAKARVAPLKDITIPRLELLACVLGTRLAASVKNDLNLPDVRIYYLTDSMTALAWIQRTRDWGVFVSIRVKEIRNLSDVSSWEHVPSEKNFADILSRVQKLVYLRWWEAPSWLSETPVQCPRSKQVPDEEAVNLEPLTVGEVVVVENSLKNRTLWSLARVIELIPGKDGHVRVARVKTETGELVRPVQRLYNLELQEPETNLLKDLTDSVIRTRRGRKCLSFFYSRKTQRWENVVKAPKSEGVVDPKSAAVRVLEGKNHRHDGNWVSSRRVARQVGRSDLTVRSYWDQWTEEMSFTCDHAQNALDRAEVEKTATSCDTHA